MMLKVESLMSDEVIDVDVIYSSKTMIALQWEDENGECDFYAGAFEPWTLAPFVSGLDASE